MNAKRPSTHLTRGLVAATVAGALFAGLSGCKSKAAGAPIVSAGTQNGGDPALANVAQPYTGGPLGSSRSGAASTTKVLGQSESFPTQASGESYGDGQQAPAPIVRQSPNGGYASPDGYTDAEEAGAEALAETDQAPPPLPEYDQPPAPDPNYIWTPGYWNYANTGYYWVPGVWVAPPFYGALWTPPYWGYTGGQYLLHRGYWGPHVGYYGGINYGFGYVGYGYFGGYWRGHDFLYNRAVTNINPGAIHNFYDRQVVYNGRTYGPHPTDRVSYNGGRGGLNVQPRPAELAAMREAHYAPEAAQRQVRLAAASDRGQFFRADGGHPAQTFAPHPVGSRAEIAATPREQPFNRPAGIPGRGVANQPANHGNPGGNQPNFNHGNPGGNQPNFNHGSPAGNQPSFNHGNSAGNQPNFTHGNRGNQPNSNHGNSAGNQPTFNHGNPAADRPAPAATAARPEGNVERQPAPVERHMQPEPRSEGTPFQRPQAAPRPAPEARPSPVQRPAPQARPAPEARPAPQGRPAPAPRGAPHGVGGEEHGGHH